MVREMLADAQDARVEAIRQLNTVGHIGVGLGAAILAGGTICGNPFIFSTGAGSAAIGGGAYVPGFWKFYELVKDHGPFDPKHKIKAYLGEGITIGDQDDIEFSDPGNILYGFVGASIGYVDQILYMGAGIAEITDPAHDPATAKKVGVDFVPFTGDVAPPYYGDSHGDHNAVAFGIYLYKVFGMGLTLSTFRSAFSQSSSGLDRHQAASWPVLPGISRNWPYAVGYFDPSNSR
jgi:hypothetical protein